MYAAFGGRPAIVQRLRKVGAVSAALLLLNGTPSASVPFTNFQCARARWPPRVAAACVAAARVAAARVSAARCPPHA